MRLLVNKMQNNEFFRLWVSNYQKGLSRTLEAGLDITGGAKDDAGSKLKKGASSKKINLKQNFSQQIMDHVSSTNYFRKKLPNIFTGGDAPNQSNILKEKLAVLAPVPMPIDIKRQSDHQKVLEKNRTIAKNTSLRSLSLNPIEEEVPNIRTEDGIRRGSMSVGPRWKQKGYDPTGNSNVNKLNFLEDETFLRRLR